jgi:hypothetical protein
MIPDMLAMGNIMERLEQLLASQKNNPDPQQQTAYDLLKRTAQFAASVRATRSQDFVPLQEEDFQFSDQPGWAVPDSASQLGTMALRDHNPTQDKTQVYYIVSHLGGHTHDNES